MQLRLRMVLLYVLAILASAAVGFAGGRLHASAPDVPTMTDLEDTIADLRCEMDTAIAEIARLEDQIASERLAHVDTRDQLGVQVEYERASGDALAQRLAIHIFHRLVDGDAGVLAEYAGSDRVEVLVEFTDDRVTGFLHEVEALDALLRWIALEAVPADVPTSSIAGLFGSHPVRLHLPQGYLRIQFDHTASITKLFATLDEMPSWVDPP